MAITLLNIKNETRDLLNEPYTDRDIPTLPTKPFFSDDELLNWINNASHELAEDTDVNYRIEEYTMLAGDVGTSITLSAMGISELFTAPNTSYLNNGDSESCWYPLDTVNARNKKVISDSSSAQQVCNFYGDTFYFSNAIVAGDKIMIPGRYDVTELSADTDVFPFCNKSKLAVIYHALANGYAKRGLTDQVALYEAKANKYFDAVNRKYLTKQKNTLGSGLQPVKKSDSLNVVRTNTVTGV